MEPEAVNLRPLQDLTGGLTEGMRFQMEIRKGAFLREWQSSVSCTDFSLPQPNISGVYLEY